MVIWRSGTSVALYRGVGYNEPLERSKRSISNKNRTQESSSSVPDDGSNSSSEFRSRNEVESPQPESAATSLGNASSQSSIELKYEDEVETLLDGLGPRYTDWPGNGPLPVDADLLPGVLPGYQPPFRILPYGVRHNLGLKEATSLRRLARVLPPHFVLGNLYSLIHNIVVFKQEF